MIKLICSGLLMMVLLSGCGWDGTPTRHNDLSPPTSLAIVADSSTIAANTSTLLKVTGDYSGQYTLDITDQAVWISQNPAVAFFSSTGAPNQVFARAPGFAILTATVRGVSQSFLLTVSQATITTLTVAPAAPSIAKGLSTQFSVSGTFSDATTQDLTYDAVWSSSAPAVASVSDAPASKGSAQGLAVGTATISATFGGVSGAALLTVTAPVAQSLALAPVSANLTVGAVKNFTATVTFSDGTTQDVTATSAWTSSAAAIATVGDSATDKGKVTAVAVGNVTISAVYAALPAATATVTVADKVLESLSLNYVGTYVFSSTTPVNFTVEANYVGGSKQFVTSQATWNSSNPNVASVDNSGQVTPGISGTTTLTATFGGKTQSVIIQVP